MESNFYSYLINYNLNLYNKFHKSNYQIVYLFPNQKFRFEFFSNCSLYKTYTYVIKPEINIHIGYERSFIAWMVIDYYDQQFNISLDEESNISDYSEDATNRIIVNPKTNQILSARLDKFQVGTHFFYSNWIPK